MRRLPKNYTLDTALTEQVMAQAKLAMSSDHYEIFSDTQQNIIGVKILNAKHNLGHELDGHFYGQLSDVYASIRWYDTADDTNEPEWTDPRSNSLKRQSVDDLFGFTCFDTV